MDAVRQALAEQKAAADAARAVAFANSWEAREMTIAFYLGVVTPVCMPHADRAQSSS